MTRPTDAELIKLLDDMGDELEYQGRMASRTILRENNRFYVAADRLRAHPPVSAQQGVRMTPLHPHAPLRTHALTVGQDGTRCDGCGLWIAGGLVALFRLDGCVFCTPRCATLHQAVELDHAGSGRKSA